MTILHLMVGLPCSGKTTMAKQLEIDTGALRLTPDEWHRYLYGQDATHPEHDQRHKKIENLQWGIAAAALKRGVDVILDFGLWSKEEREDFRQRATTLGAESKTHFLDVPIVVLLERLEKRNEESSTEVTFIPKTRMMKYLPCFEAPDEEELA